MRKQNGNELRPISTLLFLMAGVYGMLFFLHSLNSVIFLEWAVYSAAAVFSAGVWYVYSCRRNLFYWFFPASLLVCVLAVFFGKDTILPQLEQVGKSLAGAADLEPMSITLLALLLTVVIVFALFFLEIIIGKHGILYTITTCLILSGPLLGVRTGTETVLLLVLFQITFFVIHAAGSRHRKPFLSIAGRHRLAGKSSVAIGLILLPAFLIAAPLVYANAEWLYNSAYEAEGYLYRTLSTITGTADDPVEGGRISRGNNYRTGTGQLELQTELEPTQTLYLRGFGGGTYIGGDWIRSSDEALFEQIAEKLEWQEWLNMIGDMYYSMYFVMNSSMQGENLPEPRALTLKHSNGKYENAYVPYYSRRESGGAYGGYGYRRDDGYVYQFYEQKDMNIDWDNVSPDFETQRDWYRQLQEAYIEEVQSAYTQVPTEILPRLTSLCEENPLEDLDEITAFILYSLHSNASYTLTPGLSVFNEDIVENFLFERGRGYCVHFAAAATLMYRLYGIPARYASGYVVSPSDFELQEDDTYQAAVTDEAAHAWVEIFLEDYGWTPIEVTPFADGTAAAYPGFDGVVLERLMEEHGWDMEIPSLAESVSEDSEAAYQEEEPAFTFDFHIDFAKYENLFLVLVTCAAYSLCLFPLFLDYRRLRRLKKLETMGCRKVFAKLIQILHFGGYLMEYDGTEEDFAGKLSETIPSISLKEIEQMLAIVSEAAYGPSAPEAEKEEVVRKMYNRSAGFVYERLRRYQKLLFRYWKAYG